MEITWQDVRESIQQTWKNFKAFLRDKFSEKEDWGNVTIDRDYNDQSEIEDLRQDAHHKIEFDNAADTYISKRIKSLQKSRNNKFRKEHSIER